MPEVTLLYAGILGLMSIALSYPVGKLRGKTKIALGDGGNQDLLLAMRRQANFVEYVPMTVIVIALIEAAGAPAMAIHALGGGLVLFRIAHATGINAENMKSHGRGIGAGGTALVTVVASVWAIVLFF